MKEIACFDTGLFSVLEKYEEISLLVVSQCRKV